MAYSIVVSPRAQVEIEHAADYYAQDSTDAPLHFIAALRESYQSLSVNPFYRIRYKNVRALRIKKFPYMLYYVVNEQRSTVRVLSCFHSKRNPEMRPRG